MKRYILSVLAAACLSITASFAGEASPRNTDANLFGHVVDRDSGEHIPYASIAVVGTAIGTTTDVSGHYYLKNLPVGELTLEVRALGYAAVQATVTLRRGVTSELNFEVAPSGIPMDEVVVSASRSATLRREAPTLVSVLGGELFERSNASCLAQGLPFQPGVRVENDCQNCGFTQVRINGLDGHYSQILVDSHPVFSALTGVYGLEQIPSNMIERVEVLRGGGSALYGSSAIGGTINVITKEPTRSTAQLSHTLTSLGGSHSYDNNSMLNASIVSESGRAGIGIFGQSRHRSGYDHNGDGFTELPLLNSQSAGMRSYIRTGAYSRITAQYHHIEEYRRGGDLLDRPPHEANIAEQINHSIDGGSLSFDLSSADRSDRFNAYASFQNTARRSYYGSKKDLKAYGTTRDLTVAAGTQYVHAFERLWFMPAELTLGAEYSYDGLRDRSIGYNINTDQTVHIVGGYFQNEWKTSRWSLLLGGRLDKHNLVDHVIFSPRVNVRFNPAEWVNLRASYAGGYRAPQAFDEDMHIAIVGGERVRVRLAENLHEERSHSVSLSADLYHTFGSVPVNFVVEGFYTRLNDVFALRDLESPEGEGKVKERYNGSGATVGGVNAEGRAVFTRWFELQAGMTWQRSRYVKPEAWSEDPEVAPVRRMFRTPDLYGYFTASFKPWRRLTADVSGTCTGEMLVQHIAGSGVAKDVAVTTPAFCDVNLRLAYDLPLCKEIVLQLHGGVQNLFNAYQRDFDRGVERDSGYIYGPSLPRSWFVGAKIGF
ncbi:MAG TPA: TonB-dependent receptor [Candidatus Alistipes faecavium]|uniref:TonB-dependent receptor n=1 Tax=uncultured Alistipes sp. TaxID=538949 RepID=UPI001F87542F|nr:TonB-dependent receptor [uncultured Alistipes sp.]HJA96217.1 TonB-dependent receptor [Candidatus Alistipes faecavium]